jgi:RNA polymerase sigma factor (sigma-70 family)
MLLRCVEFVRLDRNQYVLPLHNGIHFSGSPRTQANRKMGRLRVTNLTSRDALIVEHLALVPIVARRAARGLPCHFNLSDMIGAGNLALVQAAERYRADRGTRFKTYAEYVVHGAIIDSVRRKTYRTDTMKSIDDLGDRLRVAPVGEAAIDADRFQDRLGKAIAALPTLQRRVLSLRYGGDVAVNLTQIAGKLGITPSKSFRLHMAAIEGIRVRLKTPAWQSWKRHRVARTK